MLRENKLHPVPQIRKKNTAKFHMALKEEYRTTEHDTACTRHM
jgi:hypothetical protein